MVRPPTGRLRTRLLVGTLVPTVLALAAFGFLAQAVAGRMLEDELGRRLAVAAAGTAALILPEQVDALADGDTASLTYANVGRKLALARQRFDVRRVAVVTRALVGRVDTAGLIAPGAEAHELGADRLELDRAAGGHPTASPLFVGHDGVAYKRGYAAIGGAAAPGARADGGGGGGPHGVVGFAVVEASADYFVPLASLRRRLVVAGAIALGLMLLVTMASARRISGPVVALTDAAARIGRGDLSAPVTATTRDEIGFLARTLDDMRAALKARDERMQMMLAGIAHEVRNPLGGLELYAGLLREALVGQPDRLEEVGRIERELGYLRAVVNDFLEYARRPALEPIDFDVAAVLADVRDLIVADAVGPRAGGDDAALGAAGTGERASEALKVALNLPSSLLVRGDEGQLRRALLNLARNAAAAALRAHAGGGARVRLTARLVTDGGDQAADSSGAHAGDTATFDGAPVGDGAAQDDGTPEARVMIEVEDNGGGVPEDLRERIFAPFFTTREKGTGLGLALVREIVRAHGGDVRVGGSGLGGARFWFTLPAARARAMAALAGATDTARGSSRASAPKQGVA